MAKDALEIWREKLAHLEREHAITSDPTKKFDLQKGIDEARSKLAEAEVDRPLISWNEMTDVLRKAAKQLKASAQRGGGFPFDIIVGVTRGGIIIADLLARHLGSDKPVVALWADRSSHYPDVTFEPPDNWVNPYVLEVLNSNEIRNILLVEDIARHGRVATSAKECVESHTEGKCVKTMVLFVDPTVDCAIDYVGVKQPVKNTEMPFSALE